MAIRVEFGIKPYPLQKEILDTLDGVLTNKEGAPYRYCIAILGRQSGKSWLAKYAALDRAINQQQQVMWVAPSIPSARVHWNDLHKLIVDSKIPVRRISQAEKAIYFKDGGVISVRSALDPDNLRGPSLDFLILDEAAFFRDGAYVWQQVCFPMLTATGGSALFCTTPNGMNWVYDLYVRGQAEEELYFKSWQAPSWKSPYQDAKLLKEIKKTMPSKAFREEFGAEFLADGGGVFAGVQRAATGEELPAPDPKREYVAGIDIGFNNDKTCFTVLDKHDRKQVYGKQMSHVGTLETIADILQLLDHWTPVITYVEKNGLGEHLLGLLQQVASGKGEHDLKQYIQEHTDFRHTGDDEGEGYDSSGTYNGHIIRGVHITNELKRNLIERLAADIEYGRLEILSPETDYGSEQIKEMSTYERKHTISGLYPTYGASIGAHDDTVAALALAYRAVPNYRPKKTVMDFMKSNGASQRSPFRGKGKVRTYNAKRN